VTRLWVIGGSGAALEVWAVHQALQARGLETLPLAGFVNLHSEASFPTEGLPCRAEREFLDSADPMVNRVVLALGSPSQRARAAATYSARGFSFETLVHPAAILGPRVTLEAGCVVMAGAVLETHVHVGPHGLINVLASIAHEGHLGPCCSLGPGARLAGKATLGARCDVGVGAVLRPGVRLGDDVVVGAGAAVVSDWSGPITLIGVPARPLCPSANPGVHV
jgi:sugar O-acyltransferase (sialic acid O-acetyltransferase NeuD family)